MSGEWVSPASKVIKFWVWQLILWIIGILLAIAIGISNPTSLMAVGPLFLIGWIASIVFYAFKIANFFLKGQTYLQGGGAPLTFLEQWKWFLF